MAHGDPNHATLHPHRRTPGAGKDLDHPVARGDPRPDGGRGGGDGRPARLSHARGIARPHLDPGLHRRHRRGCNSAVGRGGHGGRSPVPRPHADLHLRAQPVPFSTFRSRPRYWPRRWRRSSASGPVRERTAFFVDNQGFITPTEVRRITYEDTLKFLAFEWCTSWSIATSAMSADQDRAGTPLERALAVESAAARSTP